jgi:hypothetical protein
MSTNPQPPTLTIRDQMMNNFAKVLAALRAGSGLAKWDQAGILAALRIAWGMGEPAAVLHAAINATIDPSNRTPAVIGMHGPHWNATTSTRPKDSRPPLPPPPDPVDIATPEQVAAIFAQHGIPRRKTPTPPATDRKEPTP